jgi:hypothetical protein
MARFPDFGTVLSESGASIPTTYADAGLGSQFYPGTASKCRFVVNISKHASSSMTTFTVKLQGFDSGGSVAATVRPCDFVSVRDDNGTSELEHAFTLSTGANNFSFWADPRAFYSIRVAGKATGASHASDTVAITCQGF